MNALSNFSTKLHLQTLLQDLQDAEFSRNYNLTEDLFAPIWKVNETPDFSEYNSLIRGELLRLAGAYMIHIGKARNLPDYQEHGKNALTKAIDCFFSIGEIEKALDCQRLTAFSYYQEGSINEYQALLDDAESYFADKSHPVYLLIQTNYLIIEINRQETKQALFRIEGIQIHVKNSGDNKIKTLFNTQAGIVYRQSEQYEESIHCFETALKAARQLKNLHYEALITNCMANTFRSMGEYKSALELINNAINLAKNEEGWLANFLDTKANIYFDAEDFESAYDYAHESIHYFRKGDDNGGLMESLWTMSRILFNLELHEAGLQRFLELYKIGLEQTGENTAQIYIKAFIENFYISSPKGSYQQKVNKYKRYLIQNAMAQSNGKVVESANLLGFEHHQTLSKMLKNTFPDIFEDFQRNRKTRSDKIEKQ